MAGVLSKYDKNFHNYGKPFFEETILSKQSHKTSESLFSLQISGRIAEVTPGNSKTARCLGKQAKRETQTIDRKMADAENLRTTSDGVRTSSDYVRISSDDVRTSSDNVRISSDDVRTSSDNIRTSSDDVRTSSDNVRISSDAVRISSDDVRTSSENVRTSSENVRTSSDYVRTSSDDIRTSSQDVRTESNETNAVQTDSVDSRLDTPSGSNRNTDNSTSNIREGSNTTTQDRESFSDRLGIVLFNPQYRIYATPDSRLKSYENWPKESKVNVTKLTEAGFAYTGHGDSVRCFYCGGAFKNWEEDSDPWREHALYFPHCGHVRQCKGVAYIKHVCGEGDSDFEIDGDEDIVIDRVKLAMKRNESAVMAARDFCTDENLLRDGIKRILIENETFSGVDLIKATEEIKEEMKQREEVVAKSTEVECLENGGTVDSSLNSSSEIELLEENRKLKDTVMCKICLDKIATMITLPCGHMATCSQCISALTHCAICRARIKGTVRALMAI